MVRLCKLIINSNRNKMKKFIVTYHAPKEAMQQTAKPTPEQMAKGMEMWMNWAKKCGSNLLDLGSPLVNGQVIGIDGQIKNSNINLTGYSILQAEDMEQLETLLEGHPHLTWNALCTIEIHELQPMPGM